MKSKIKKKFKKSRLWGRSRTAFAFFKNPMAIAYYVWFKIIKRIKSSASKKHKLHEDKIITYMIGFSPWKNYMDDWFPDRHLVFLNKNIKFSEFLAEVGISHIFKKDFEVFQWGFKIDPELDAGLKKIGISKYIIEDGFIRSIGLGSTKTPPFSLCLDKKTAYFDSRFASDLEDILNSYNFSADIDLMQRAETLRMKLLASGLSKYNLPSDIDISEIYGEKNKKRVLVVGQVEDDASIMFGCNKKMTNNDVVIMAALENPEAQIIYKPHPDVLHGHRAAVSNPEDVKSFALVLEDLNIPLSESFKTIDHVYTITSQAGFEAVMRGIEVTTLGCPFYSGWGLTNDRQPNCRRKRKLTVNEVFAAAYILYPKYFDPIHKKPIQAEEAIDTLLSLKDLYAGSGDNVLEVIENEEGQEEVEFDFERYVEMKEKFLHLELEMLDVFGNSSVKYVKEFED